MWSFPRFIRLWIGIVALCFILLSIVFRKPIFFILALNVVKRRRFNIIFFFIIFDRDNILIRIWQIVYKFNLPRIFIIRINVKKSLEIQILFMNPFNWSLLVNSLRRLKWYLNRNFITSFIDFGLSLKIEVLESDSLMVVVLYFLCIWK